MNNGANREGAAQTATPAPGQWEKALAYSELKEHLKTPEDEARFLATLEESLSVSLGIDEVAAKQADLAGILRLFFTSETFSFADEHGTQYVWSVTKAKQMVATGAVPLVVFAPSEHDLTKETLLACNPSIDKARAAIADLAEPVIFIAFSGEHLLLDGWHRVYRAVVDYTPSIPCYVLDEAQAESILVSKTHEGGDDHE